MSITQNKGDGFEIVYFEVGRAYLESAMRGAAGNRDKFNSLIMDACLYRPVPVQGEYEIMTMEELPDKPAIFGIHVKLKRGHWQISEFTHRHADHHDALEARMSGDSWYITCRRCKDELRVLVSSMPRIPWSLRPIPGIHDRDH